MRARQKTRSAVGKGIRIEAAASTPEVQRQGTPVEKPGRRPGVRPARETGVRHMHRGLRHQAGALLEHLWGGGSMSGRAGQGLHLHHCPTSGHPGPVPLTCLCQSQLERRSAEEGCAGSFSALEWSRLPDSMVSRVRATLGE